MCSYIVNIYWIISDALFTASRTICSDPGGIINGWRNPGYLDEEQKFYVGKKLFYHCFKNYKLSGVNILTCNNNGQWESPTVPTCVPSK